MEAGNDMEGPTEEETLPGMVPDDSGEAPEAAADMPPADPEEAEEPAADSEEVVPEAEAAPEMESTENAEVQKLPFL